MTDTYKRLGAVEIDGSSNAVDTNINLYTVPGSTETIVSSINICNRSNNSADDIQIAHVDGAIGVVADEDWIVFNIDIPAENHENIILGITMEATHSLLVRSGIVDVNFIAWGIEKT